MKKIQKTCKFLPVSFKSALNKCPNIRAFWIIFVGTAIGALSNVVFGEVFVGISAWIIGFVIQLILWLGLVKHFYDTETWGKAFVIAIVAVIVTAIIFAVLAAILVGIGMLAGWTWV